MARLTPIVMCFWVVFLPTIAVAQQTSAIAGVVTDTTGAVLPGVTVEAASPALIEQARSVVTDGQGLYKIVAMPVGVFSVTFTLPGFSVVLREGIRLTTGFTATVNAEMAVGDLEETVTVTGASPVVDVQNVQTANVLSREIIAALPTGKNLKAWGQLTLGATPVYDVGGTTGERTGGFGVHGNSDLESKWYRGDMPLSQGDGQGDASRRKYQINLLGVEEIAVRTAGFNAEHPTGGAAIHIIPKDGGNAFTGTVVGSGSGPALQSDNLSDSLRDRGASTPTSVKRLYDVGIGLGGPIAKDRVWFYTSHRYWGAEEHIAGVFGNSNTTSHVYVEDRSVRGVTHHLDRDNSARITWQINRSKIVGSTSWQCNEQQFGPRRNLGAAGTQATSRYCPSGSTQAVWTYPATNRLLLEAGYTYMKSDRNSRRDPRSLVPDNIAYRERNTQFTWGAYKYSVASQTQTQTPIGNPAQQPQSNMRLGLTYVTGSHALKTGFTVFDGLQRQVGVISDPPLLYEFRGGVPDRFTQWASPFVAESDHIQLGAYVQDQWTLRRFTFNFGRAFRLHARNGRGHSERGRLVQGSPRLSRSAKHPELEGRKSAVGRRIRSLRQR